MPDKIFGEVDSYNSREGFGVIEGEDGIEYTVHQSDLSSAQKELFLGERVTFRTFSRGNPSELIAYDITILPLEIDESAVDLLTAARRIHQQYRHYIENRARYNVWHNVMTDFPEFSDGFHKISERFNLQLVPLDENTVASVFPPSDHMPYGAYLKSNDADDQQERRGAYVCFRGNYFSLIVHAFYANSMKEIICWRAKLLRHSDGNLVPMPDKKDHQGRMKTNSWRQNFSLFLDDIQEMMDISSGSMSYR